MMIFGKYVLIVLVSLLLFSVISFLGVPVYRFAQGQSFSGEHIYNPYAGTEPGHWRKANFHAHQSEKPQCDYSAAQMLDAYRTQGYDIMSISDHQKLNLAQDDRPGFIPTYEHCYCINRYHLLVMGARSVSWREFPIMLTQSQMQYMIHWLKPQGDLIVLNHPGQTRLIDHEIYGWLRGYDLLELNPEMGRERSDRRWDAALSAGIYSNLIADDDAHSITNRDSWFQRCFTRVNTPSLERKDICTALREGRAYGVYLPSEVNCRQNPHSDLPAMEEIALRDDTVTLRLDRPASSIVFIGQNGTVLAEQKETLEARYTFRPNDTYVRAEARFGDGVILYFNPFVRTPDGAQPVNVFIPVINYPLTILSHLLWLGLTLALGIVLARLFGIRLRWLKPVRVPGLF